MSYSITADEENQIIFVNYTDDVSIEEREAAVGEITKLNSDVDYNRILVDLREARLIINNPAEQDEFVTRLSLNPVLKKCKTVYLSNTEHDNNFFIELLARARHFNCKHCTSIDVAYDWLLDNNKND